MLARLWNSLISGAKTMLYGLAGAALAQALAALADIHPGGVAGIVWSTVGYSVAVGFIKSLQRMIAYKVELDTAVVGPLVPLSAVPAEEHGEILANVETIKKSA